MELYVFTHIRPVSIARATRIARLRFCVNTPPPRPYKLSLACSITSSSLWNLITTATGPKISSRATRISFVASTISVGLMKQPLPSSPSVTRTPPAAMRAPSSLARST